MTERFIGPLPEEAIRQTAEELGSLADDRIVQIAARDRYGQKMASLMLREANSKLAKREFDTISGTLSKEEWLERADQKIIGMNMGRRAREKKNSGAVLLMFDAEEFKLINDNISWAEGNRRLGIIGGYITDMARVDEGDLVGRLGGDEFVWLAAFNPQDTARLEFLNSIEDRLRDLAEGKYPDLLSLRWNHTFYESGDDISSMLERLDVKGEQKHKTRSHSQSEADYEAALSNAGVALSN